MPSKNCSSCHLFQPITNFGRNRQTKDGLNYYCKTCAADKQREWALAHPAEAKAAKERYLSRMRATNTLRGDPYEHAASADS